MRAMTFASMGIFCVVASQTAGQSLLRDVDPPPQPGTVEAVRPPAEPLKETSLIQVEAPKPKEFAVHDLVTIIVSENHKASSESSLDTKKDTSLKAKLNKFPDLSAFLEAALQQGASSPIVEADVSSGNSFKGDGKYETKESLTDKIQATIIDVKPNGTLVVEARRTISKDNQTQTMVLSGTCRREDVTDNNSVLSSQLAELTVNVESTGDVKDSASKGLLTRFFDAVFNF
ncbi:MAG: flagellar basal body L-ring protein FlgH [Phycisphaerales bacterium]